MNKSCLLVIIFLLAVLYPCLGQNFGESYINGIKRADSLFHVGMYKSAAESYNSAFIGNGGLAYLPDRYTAACAWSMAQQSDSAFYHLFRIIERVKYDELEKVQSDTSFQNLHNDPRWSQAISLIKNNKESKEAKYNRPLIAVLDTVFREDQRYRLTVNDTIEKYGYGSPQIRKLDSLIIKSDSVNLIIVKRILDNNGWLGPDIIGNHGNTLFLVIQHSDLDTQVKYLPVMREAVKRNAAESSSLALLEDRIALAQGKCQIYGSQIGLDKKTNRYYVLPLSDPTYVDERRKGVDLGPIKEYVTLWKITWNQDQYNQQLQKILGKRALKK
jgi:hypothetical protein